MRIFKKVMTVVISAATAIGGISLTANSVTYERENVKTTLYADDYEDIISGCDYTITVRLSGKMLTAAYDKNVI